MCLHHPVRHRILNTLIGDRCDLLDLLGDLLPEKHPTVCIDHKRSTYRISVPPLHLSCAVHHEGKLRNTTAFSALSVPDLRAVLPDTSGFIGVFSITAIDQIAVFSTCSQYSPLPMSSVHQCASYSVQCSVVLCVYIVPTRAHSVLCSAQCILQCA